MIPGYVLAVAVVLAFFLGFIFAALFAAGGED